MKQTSSGAAEAPAPYLAAQDTRRQREDATIRRALAILKARLAEPGHLMSSPESARSYLRLHHAGREHEVFTVVYLDVKNRVVEVEDLFRGTLTSTTVHPREIVKGVLARNAASIMLSHNHPSGVADPSEADLRLTNHIREALALIDVRVLDHIITTAATTYSFAEHGQL